MNYAVVDATNFVINIIVWDGESPWQPPVDCTAVQIPPDSAAGIGWNYVDGKFVPPPEV